MDIRYAGVPDRNFPGTESLKDAIGRVMPYWECIIFPALMYKDSLLVVAHGNSLRGNHQASQRDFRYGYFQPEPAYGGSLCL